jgi:hypothetical protein
MYQAKAMGISLSVHAPPASWHDMSGERCGGWRRSDPRQEGLLRGSPSFCEEIVGSRHFGTRHSSETMQLATAQSLPSAVRPGFLLGNRSDCGAQQEGKHRTQ